MTRLLLALFAAATALSGGCAALTNPVADGIPVNRLPAELLGRSKADLMPVPQTVLQQREAEPYRLDKGDVLAVIADNVISPPGLQPPIKLADPVSKEVATGYPVPVRDDGTISLPGVDPIPVKGLSVAEAEVLVKEYVTGRRGGVELLPKNARNIRVSVALYTKRLYRVTVLREDAQAFTQQSGSQVIGQTRRGAGYTINLPAGENDVLRALNATGGLPGLDARNEVTVLRNVKGRSVDPPVGQPVRFEGAARSQLVMNGEVVAVRIPLRIYREQTLTVREEDIILKDGDVVLIEARDTELYYTAGLIGGGEYQLPRDRDLNVIQAIAQVRGPLLNGGFTQNAFVGSSTGSGIGSPSPSQCTVLRQWPNGRQVVIEVDLNRAFKDPRERLLIQPGDYIVLQERPNEAFARYFTQTFRLNTAFDLATGSASGVFSGNQ